MADLPGIPAHLRLEFVTPAQAIAHADVDEVQLPGEEGSFGVLPGHAPLLAALSTGAMWYRKGTQIHHAFISGGFVEVLPDRVSILAQVAERAEDIDLERAEAARRRAEEQLAKPTTVDFDAERARIAMLRAITRIQVSRQTRTRG
jgi:F-type H+-transporting ATPase subunit epsilon